MKLTREMIFEGQTPRGAWNRNQLEIIGVPWPPIHGWIDRAIGQEISPAQFEKFKSLGQITPEQRKAFRRERREKAKQATQPPLL